MRCGTGIITKLRLKQVQTTVSAAENMLSEAFPTTVTDAGAVGFVLSRLKQTSDAILWVQDRQSQKESGHPYLPALPDRLVIQVATSRPADVLWAMEEGLRCQSLSAVIGEIWGTPPALSFTATKRLSIRAEYYKIPCWLIRRATSPGISAARNRWRVASLPSHPHPDDAKAPGDPRWQVELFRSRTQKPGTWVATYDRTSDRVCFSTPLRDGAVADSDGAERHSAAR